MGGTVNPGGAGRPGAMSGNRVSGRSAGSGRSGGSPADRSGAGKPSAGRPNGKKRKLSKRQRAIYRRRRIVVFSALVVVLFVLGFTVYSLGRGAGAVINVATGNASHAVLERSTSPEPHHSATVKNCTAKNTRLELTAKTATVAVGGSLDWVATITHEGSDSCIIDASDSGRVLTITSGGETVWRSDSCPTEARTLLMAKGDKDVQTITWNASRTSDQCVENKDDLPKVDRGTYVGVLSLKNAPKVKSQPVTVEVQ